MGDMKDKKKIRTYRDVVLQKANIDKNFRAGGTFQYYPTPSSFVLLE